MKFSCYFLYFSFYEICNLNSLRLENLKQTILKRRKMAFFVLTSELQMLIQNLKTYLDSSFLVD